MIEYSILEKVARAHNDPNQLSLARKLLSDFEALVDRGLTDIEPSKRDKGFKEIAPNVSKKDVVKPADFEISDTEWKDLSFIADLAYGQAVLRTKTLTVGTLIRRIRISTGLSQAQVAQRIGIHQTLLSKIEGGKRSSSVETIVKIYEVLNSQTNDTV